MSDTPKPAAPPTAAPAETPGPKPGGFGAFAEVYRARWAANHPNARPRDAAPDAEPDGPAPTTPADGAPQGNGTRPHTT